MEPFDILAGESRESGQLSPSVCFFSHFDDKAYTCHFRAK